MNNIKKCFTCSLGILMPDGNTWCSITFQPDDCSMENYIKGFPKLYKPVKTEKKQTINKKVIKTPPIKTTKVKTIIKKGQKQHRLF